MGVGSSASCGSWTQERHDGQNFLYEQWVLGFLSGVGWAGGSNYNPLEGLDYNAVTLWMDNYCKSRPLESIVSALVAFIAAHPR